MERPATTLSINAFTQVKAPFPPGMRMPPQFGGPERLDNPDVLKEAGDPVLLVEDAIETGRMLAVAARMLRRSERGGCYRWSWPYNRGPCVAIENSGQGYTRRIVGKRSVAPIARCRNQVRQEELRSAPRTARP